MKSGIAPERNRPRDEGRAIFQPTDATKVAAQRLMQQDPSLTRTAAVRVLADLGARQATYDLLREERVAERMAAFAEMMGALSEPVATDDTQWEEAMMSLRSDPKR